MGSPFFDAAWPGHDALARHATLTLEACTMEGEVDNDGRPTPPKVMQSAVFQPTPDGWDTEIEYRNLGGLDLNRRAAASAHAKAGLARARADLADATQALSALLPPAACHLLGLTLRYERAISGEHLLRAPRFQIGVLETGDPLPLEGRTLTVDEFTPVFARMRRVAGLLARHRFDPAWPTWRVHIAARHPADLRADATPASTRTKEGPLVVLAPDCATAVIFAVLRHDIVYRTYSRDAATLDLMKRDTRVTVVERFERCDDTTRAHLQTQALALLAVPDDSAGL